ncbi:MAG TPA: hypothetical protein VMV31_04490 [Terriglobales bacterium]|nr:hypothetical protein [Terriglobales bacterium]
MIKHQAKKAKQYTVRDVPREVDRVLRQRAQQRRVSLNQLIVDELTAATLGQRRRGDFSDLVGRWREDPELDAALQAQRRIDEGLWN